MAKKTTDEVSPNPVSIPKIDWSIAGMEKLEAKMKKGE